MADNPLFLMTSATDDFRLGGGGGDNNNTGFSLPPLWDDTAIDEVYANRQNNNNNNNANINNNQIANEIRGLNPNGGSFNFGVGPSGARTSAHPVGGGSANPQSRMSQFLFGVSGNLPMFADDEVFGRRSLEENPNDLNKLLREVEEWNRIDFSSFNLERELGAGRFGTVYLARRVGKNNSNGTKNDGNNDTKRQGERDADTPLLMPAEQNETAGRLSVVTSSTSGNSDSNNRNLLEFPGISTTTTATTMANTARQVAEHNDHLVQMFLSVSPVIPGGGPQFIFPPSEQLPALTALSTDVGQSPAIFANKSTATTTTPPLTGTTGTTAPVPELPELVAVKIVDCTANIGDTTREWAVCKRRAELLLCSLEELGRSAAGSSKLAERFFAPCGFAEQVHQLMVLDSQLNSNNSNSTNSQQQAHGTADGNSCDRLLTSSAESPVPQQRGNDDDNDDDNHNHYHHEDARTPAPSQQQPPTTIQTPTAQQLRSQLAALIEQHSKRVNMMNNNDNNSVGQNGGNSTPGSAARLWRHMAESAAATGGASSNSISNAACAKLRWMSGDFFLVDVLGATVGPWLQQREKKKDDGNNGNSSSNNVLPPCLQNVPDSEHREVCPAIAPCSFGIVLELLSGSVASITQRVCAKPHLARKLAAATAAMVGAALRFLHEQLFFLHADIKLDNILFNARSGLLRLCDFGCSLPLQELTLDNDPNKVFVLKDESSSSSSGADTFAGSLMSMSPERLGGSLCPSLRIGTAADIWSLGIALVQLICGEHPVNLLDREMAMANGGAGGGFRSGSTSPASRLSPSSMAVASRGPSARNLKNVAQAAAATTYAATPTTVTPTTATAAVNRAAPITAINPVAAGSTSSLQSASSIRSGSVVPQQMSTGGASSFIPSSAPAQALPPHVTTYMMQQQQQQQSSAAMNTNSNNNNNPLVDDAFGQLQYELVSDDAALSTEQRYWLMREKLSKLYRVTVEDPSWEYVAKENGSHYKVQRKSGHSRHHQHHHENQQQQQQQARSNLDEDGKIVNHLNCMQVLLRRLSPIYGGNVEALADRRLLRFLQHCLDSDPDRRLRNLCGDPFVLEQLGLLGDVSVGGNGAATTATTTTASAGANELRQQHLLLRHGRSSSEMSTSSSTSTAAPDNQHSNNNSSLNNFNNTNNNNNMAMATSTSSSVLSGATSSQSLQFENNNTGNSKCAESETAHNRLLLAAAAAAREVFVELGM